MATFFGEIRSLSSRAVDDEEADNQPNYTVFIENTVEKNRLDSNLKLLIFSVGEIASIFVKSHFLLDNSALVSTLKCVRNETEDDSTFYTGMHSRKNVKKVIASIFAQSTDILVCNISGSVPEEVCFEATEIIFQHFSPSQVLILSSQHMSTYKTESSQIHDLPFLKVLSTSQYMLSHKCSIPRLHAPNFLYNMAASLLLKCEITKLPALCVINYVDTDIVDSLNVQVFANLLKETILSKVAVNHDANERVARYVKAKLVIESSLYS